MKLSITGLNHKTAPVEVREKLAFDERALPDAFRALKSQDGIEEALILSTCNRVEVAVATGDAADPQPWLIGFLARSGHIEPQALGQHLYHYEGPEAVRHLFRVAASLDSMVVGEPQILGQMKAAYAQAKVHGGVGGFLDNVLTRAFSVAKRVRTETEIGQSAVSVSYVAVELAREIFGSLSGRKVLIVGAGKMSELAARYLHRSGAAQIFVTNRTQDRAVEMAQVFKGSVVEYNRFAAMLPEIDIVITSSGAPHYILYKQEIKRAIELRRNRPMFLIDIAVPRNIEPSVNDLDNVFLYDIDDLQKVVDRNRQGRRQHAEQADQIISEEVDRTLARLKAREASPVILRLQEQLEQLRQTEVDRLRPRFGELTPQQEETLEALTRAIMAKIAHAPIAELRRHAGEPDGLQTAELIRRVFRLEE
ncbi:MAG TPA: glutamyl-tRNA reductase [Bryobacteraceae bacterium]|nr:glutamyl-tRNA reductase [Bryobacteraceae bacterium]